MADANLCAVQVLGALRTVPGSETYDGYVPGKVPETAGYIDPYIVLWGGTGDAPSELPADGRQDSSTLIWDFQTTAVAASAEACRTLDQAVQAKLTNLAVGTGRVRRNPDSYSQQPPTLDAQITPARFYLPRQWRLITN